METYDSILQRMEDTYEQESGCKVEDVSEVGLRLRVLAGELYRLETSMDWLERQAFPQTATGEQLDLHGAQRGVVRKAAVKATGVVSFSRYLPLSFDLVVPAGTLCATSGEPVVEYQTTQEAVLEAGQLTVDIPVEAVVAGASGNAAAGYVTTLVNAPTGINYASNESAITGGKDAEEDEAYRQRILEAYAHSPNGANADYYREIALAQEGVTLVQVVPRANGAGTVALYLWGEGSAPSQTVIDGVQDVLDSQREIGVTVNVQAAVGLPANIPVSIKVPDEVDLAWAEDAVETAVKAYFATLNIGEGFLVTDVSRAILDAVPVEKLEFDSIFQDMAGIQGILMQAGTVSVEELS